MQPDENEPGDGSTSWWTWEKAAAIAAIAAIPIAIFAILVSHSDASRGQVVPTTASAPPATPSGRPVSVFALSIGARSVDITAKIDRPPTQGHVYWFVLEVHDVAGTHSEWYPQKDLAILPNFIVKLPDDADITRLRTGTVYEVTAETGDNYRTGRPDPNTSDDFILTKPCNCEASNVVTLPFK